MPHLDWDPENPPAEPPPGADTLIWRLAHGLRTDHSRVGVDGFCVTCRTFSPCRPLRLAERGLVLAVKRHPPPARLSGMRN